MDFNQNQALRLLMDRVKASDKPAFQELYNRLWKVLYIRSYTIMRSKFTAEDIVQEVFIDLWQRRETIENSNIEAYLYRAVQLKAFNYYRNEKNRESILQNLLQNQKFESNETEDEITFNETKQTILKSIHELPPKCRKVFELSRIDGLTNKEISKQLQISTSTIESHITNAIKIIKSNTGFYMILILSFFN